MKSKGILLLGLVLMPITSNADTSCIGFVSTDPITFVDHYHSLSYVNCPCNCSENRFQENSSCVVCGHKHGDSNVIQTAKTNGNFIQFMPPSQAKVACSTCSHSDWYEMLAGYVKEKEAHYFSNKDISKNNQLFSESKKR